MGGQDDRLKILMSNQGMHPHKDDKAGKEILKSNISIKCIAIIWVVWRERNARIFEDKTRNSENLWDAIHFLTSLWAFCSKVFTGTPLIVLQLDWLAACNSFGLI